MAEPKLICENCPHDVEGCAFKSAIIESYGREALEHGEARCAIKPRELWSEAEHEVNLMPTEEM